MKNILITFSGMDGTGKTTLAKKLEEYLKTKGYRVYFKHAHGYAISQNSFAIDEKNISRFRWIFTIFSPYIVIDSWITYLFKYQPILKNKILICDRYFYDKIARLLFYRIINVFFAKLFLYLLPKPNTFFFLDVDEKKAFERKKEYSPSQVRNFRYIYRWIAKEMKATIIKTDSAINRSFEDLIQHLSIDLPVRRT